MGYVKLFQMTCQIFKLRLDKKPSWNKVKTLHSFGILLHFGIIVYETEEKTVSFSRSCRAFQNDIMVSILKERILVHKWSRIRKVRNR